jgi:hypothetical protein
MMLFRTLLRSLAMPQQTMPSIKAELVMTGAGGHPDIPGNPYFMFQIRVESECGRNPTLPPICLSWEDARELAEGILSNYEEAQRRKESN